MNSLDILALLGPLTPFLCGCTFIAFWFGQKKSSHILMTGCSLIIFSLVLLFVQYFVRVWTSEVALATILSSSLAVYFFSHAMSSRLGLSNPALLIVATAIIGACFGVFSNEVFDDFGYGLFAFGCTFSVQFLIIGLNMLRYPQLSKSDYAVVVMVLLIALLAVGPLLGFWRAETVGTAETFTTTTFWHFIDFTVAVTSLVLSMTLIATFMGDLFQKIRLLSDIDVLTGVKSRRAFESEAKSVFAQQARANLPISLIVTDLDHFKQINDEHGHLVGDRVLTFFGNMLNNALRTTDVIGRIGGEEFCIILWNTPEDGAVFVAEGLRARLEAATIQNVPAGTEVTASFGVIEVAERETYASAFERADKSMYFAKQTGRNRVCVGNKVTQKQALADNYDDQYWADTARTTSLS